MAESTTKEAEGVTPIVASPTVVPTDPIELNIAWLLEDEIEVVCDSKPSKIKWEMFKKVVVKNGVPPIEEKVRISW